MEMGCIQKYACMHACMHARRQAGVTERLHSYDNAFAHFLHLSFMLP